jgi:hypothetical protein
MNITTISSTIVKDILYNTLLIVNKKKIFFTIISNQSYSQMICMHSFIRHLSRTELFSI